MEPVVIKPIKSRTDVALDGADWTAGDSYQQGYPAACGTQQWVKTSKRSVF